MKIKTVVPVILSLIYLLISCVTPKTKIEGLISDIKRSNPNHFYFYQDSTFLYKFHGYTKYKYSHGKWSVNKNKIIINSELLEKDIPISVLESDNLSKISQISVLINKTNKNDYKCMPFSDTGVLLFDPPKGFYTLNLGSLPNGIYFEVYYLPDSISSTRWPNDVLKTEIVLLDQSKDYELTININDSLFNYRVFNNTELRMQGNKIIFFDEEENTKNKLQIVPKSKYE